MLTTTVASLHACIVRTPFRSTFGGNAQAVWTPSARACVLKSGPRRLVVQAGPIDTGYKKTVRPSMLPTCQLRPLILTLEYQ